MKSLVLFFLFVILFSSIAFAIEFGRGPESQEILSQVTRGTSIYQPVTSSILFFGILIILTIFGIFLYKKNKIPIVIAGIGWLVFLISLFGSPFIPSEPTITEDWQVDYNKKLFGSGLSSEYNEETEYYDFSNPIIKNETYRILSNSESLDDAVVGVLNTVYFNVIYNPQESDQRCFDLTASEIFVSKTGQCDTQSIVIISLLRGMNIAARPVVGCISKKEFCDFKQSIMQSFNFVFREPKWKEVIILPNVTEVGRGGGLHAWVEYWNPEKGWIPLEATTGYYADTACYDYWIETYPLNENKESICVTRDLEFANACRLK